MYECIKKYMYVYMYVLKMYVYICTYVLNNVCMYVR